jgi:hypothetical protein
VGIRAQGEATGRTPFVVIGEVAIFSFEDFEEALAACTRLALADGSKAAKRLTEKGMDKI